MCVGHSFGLVEGRYRLIASAEKFVDITSLSPADYQFRAAIRNAITILSAKPNPPVVRILTSDVPEVYSVNTASEVQDFTRDVAASSKIQVAVGTIRSSDTSGSWNHSKIVAVDGKTSIVGGHNMWSRQYLGVDPVNDTSMQVTGTAAADAHDFANVLWGYICKNTDAMTQFSGSAAVHDRVSGSIVESCPPEYDLPATPGASTTTVISVGRLGDGIESNGNQADVARLAMMNAAQTTLRIVQQDIGPMQVPVLGVGVAAWSTAEMQAFASALARGVNVYVLLSNLGASAGGLPLSQANYSNGWKVSDVGAHIKNYMESNPGYPTGAALDALLCTKLHMAPLRYNATDSTWPDGEQFANHTKIVEVDSQGIFISSYNMYPADLQEFGYIVDDSNITGDWLSQYWSSAWQYSSMAAISGTGTENCELVDASIDSGTDAGVEAGPADAGSDATTVDAGRSDVTTAVDASPVDVTTTAEASKGETGTASESGVDVVPIVDACTDVVAEVDPDGG
jgi:phosphatidylserine/phosphatidylglycerophosphate/cardiolipin synthase-like enzyme